MSLPLNMYKSMMASSFAARGVEQPVGVAAPAPTYTQQMTAQFMAPAKKEFSASIRVSRRASVSERARRRRRRALARGPARVLRAREGFSPHILLYALRATRPR